MDVKAVPTMGWTNRSVAATILLVNLEQRQAMATRIASLMDAGGLTNETLAYKSGVSVKTVSRLLHARHEPHIGTIEKIAAALKVDEAAIRGEPPSPLGLGRSAGEAQIADQLKRIEQALVTVIELLTGRLDPLAVEAAQALDDLAAGLHDLAEPQRKPAVRRPSSARAASGRSSA